MLLPKLVMKTSRKCQRKLKSERITTSQQQYMRFVTKA